MNRLTKTYLDGTYGVADILPCGENSYDFKNLLIKTLGKYEDLEEQGLLIKLPCKVNDEVYKLADYGNWLDIEHILIPVKCKVELICLGFDNKVYCDLVNIDEIYGINNEVYEEIPINEIFLTREEAEKALEVENE